MPACARREIMDFSSVGAYHCYSRCVRRAFLCGRDDYSGNNYDHRKDWLETRLEFLASCMAIDLLAVAILDNHFHVIVRNRPELAEQWSDHEVARRWLTLCPGTREKKRKRDKSDTPNEPSREKIDELLADKTKIGKVRERLSSISWMMKLLKEKIARIANEEDNVRGHFFEGRFRSTRLLDMFALVAAVMYVELNPIRAGTATTPEASQHASVSKRIRARQAQQRPSEDRHTDSKAPSASGDAALAAAWLAPVDLDAPPPDGNQADRGRRASDRGFLEMTLDQFLTLLDWSGRQLRTDKRGAIPADLAPILQRLEVDVDFWLLNVERFGHLYSTAAGKFTTLVNYARDCGRRWLRGQAPPTATE